MSSARGDAAFHSLAADTPRRAHSARGTAHAYGHKRATRNTLRKSGHVVTSIVRIFRCQGPGNEFQQGSQSADLLLKSSGRGMLRSR